MIAPNERMHMSRLARFSTAPGNAHSTPQSPYGSHPHRLDPSFLIAATINADGDIELPDAREEGARIWFCLDEVGGIQQRRSGRIEPLDMLLLAESLTRLLGENTPQLFELRASEDGATLHLSSAGAEFDRARLRLLQNAFAVYLTVYEERLV